MRKISGLMDKITGTKIIIAEQAGLKRTQEPVTVGIPFPKGLLTDRDDISLLNADNNAILLQTEILAVWPDKSIKWLLCDFMADCPPNATAEYFLNFAGGPSQQVLLADKIRIEDRELYLTVDTGKASFTLNKREFYPFKSIRISGHELIDEKKSRVILKDETLTEYKPVIKKMEIATNGYLRSTVKAEGQFQSETGKVFSEFFARLFFYAGKGLVRIEFTVRNPKAAKHPGGLWDLGDKGSVFFEDLSFYIGLPEADETSVLWKSNFGGESKRSASGKIEIYQDSSGGENWDSPNHVNRYGKVMNSFRGYKVMAERLVEEGHRALPTVSLVSADRSFSAGMQNFWQNFPKAIEAEKNTLTVRLFPHQYRDVFELQGGEQKTHTIFFEAGTDSNESMNLDWIQEPVVPRAMPEWYIESGAPFLTSYADDNKYEIQKMIDAGIKGDYTFFHKREIIDEYGWRNFGDIYADHEALEDRSCPDSEIRISHYNNQYDMIYGFLIQYLKSGNNDWLKLARDLVRHVADIDIYHTQLDRYAYNGGLFWHTDHFMDAATSTHRTFSKVNKDNLKLKLYGGGPGEQHNYTTGLLYYYFLTGDGLARDAVTGLTEWMLNAMEKSNAACEIMKRKGKTIIKGLTGIFNGSTNETSQHNMNRGPGNSINSLIDAYMLKQDEKYISKIEELIKNIIHPDDDISSRDLLNAPRHWSYTVFLMAVARYMETKEEIGELDEVYHYAKKCLAAYALWMTENEYPYNDKPELLDNPVYATWAAQDLRKTVVLLYAARNSGDRHKNEFISKARHFYDRALKDLEKLRTRSCTRPIALLMLISSLPLFYFKE